MAFDASTAAPVQMAQWWAAGKLRKLRSALEVQDDRGAAYQAAARPLVEDDDEATRFHIGNKTEIVLERGTVWRSRELPVSFDEPTSVLANRWIARLPLPTPADGPVWTRPAPLPDAQQEKLAITRLAQRVAARLGAAELRARERRSAEAEAEAQPAALFASVVRDIQVPTRAALEASGAEVDSGQRSSQRAAAAERMSRYRLAEAELVESRVTLQLAAELLPGSATAAGSVAEDSVADGTPASVDGYRALLARSRQAREMASATFGPSHHCDGARDSSAGAADVDFGSTASTQLPTPAALIAERLRDSRALLACAEQVLGSVGVGESENDKIY